MRAGWLLGALLVGCGGDGGDGGPDADTDTDPGGGSVDPCEDIPPFDLTGMTCEQLGNAFETTMYAADACEDAVDCLIITPECTHWNQVGCWYTANSECIAPTSDGPGGKIDVAAFNSAAAGCGVAQPCSCDGGTPPTVDCIDGRCQLVGGSSY